MVKNRFLLVALVILWSLSGCERLGSVNIAVEGGNAPVFKLSGTGYLLGIYVYGPRPGETIAVPDEVPLWVIHNKPDGTFQGTYGGRLMDSVGTVPYGQVPSRFEQRFPLGGAQPQRLVEGIVYIVHLETTNAYEKSVFVQMKNGKASQIQVPNLCIEKRGGDAKWEKLECDTGKPFTD